MTILDWWNLSDKTALHFTTLEEGRNIVDTINNDELREVMRWSYSAHGANACITNKRTYGRLSFYVNQHSTVVEYRDLSDALSNSDEPVVDIMALGDMFNGLMGTSTT